MRRGARRLQIPKGELFPGVAIIRINERAPDGYFGVFVHDPEDWSEMGNSGASRTATRYRLGPGWFLITSAATVEEAFEQALGVLRRRL